jgi:RND family efflux transporter MFP subunit
VTASRPHRRTQGAFALHAARSLALVASCALALLGCNGAEAAKPDKRRGDQTVREVRLVRVTAQKLARTVNVSGTLAPDEQVTVSVKVGGRLASIAVDLGSVVKRDEVIARVEATDYQLRVEQAASALAQARALLGLPPEPGERGDAVDLELSETSLVREAQATFEEARANLERARTLVEQRMIAAADYETAKATFVRAESAVARAREEIRNRQAAVRQRSFELRAARQQLADAAIRSPLDGVVQERHALAGEYLAAGSSVATVVRVNPLRMRAEVPERDAPLIRVGQTVTVALDGTDARHEGRVVRIAPALDEQNRALMIEAEVANPGTLRPGTFARAEIAVEGASEVPVVPASAVVTFAGIDKVITVEKDKAVEKEIETGRRSEQWTEVLSGVAVGDSVVVEPGNLQQGQPVRVTGTQ